MGLRVSAPWGGFDLEKQLESQLVGLEASVLGRLLHVLFSHEHRLQGKRHTNKKAEKCQTL